MPVGIAWALHGLSYTAYKQRDYERAAALARQTLQLRWRLNDLWEIPSNLEDLADIAGQTGQAVRAARLYGAAEALRAAIDLPMQSVFVAEHEREMEVARSQLGASAFAIARANGRALSLEEAIAEALSTDEGSIETTANDPFRAAVEAAGLTDREQEVLRLLTDGLSNRAIADALFISIPTVKHHVTRILAKLGQPSRAAAIAYAHRLRVSGEPPFTG